MTFIVEGFYRNNFYLSSLLDTTAPKLLFLQEIWAPYHQENALNKKYPDYNVQISSPDMFTPAEDLLCNADHTWHGSAIMWHTSLDSSVSKIVTTNSRFTAIRITIQEERFLAISVYFPTSGKDDEYLECTSDLCYLAAEYRNENYTILIGTDSNCSEKSSARRNQALLRLCQDLDLEKVCTSQSTFHHHNGSSESNIDYFLISRKYAAKLSKLISHCTTNTPSNFSSHDPVLGSLQIPPSCHPGSVINKFSHTYTDFVQQRVLWRRTDLTSTSRLLPLPSLGTRRCSPSPSTFLSSVSSTQEFL